MVPADLGQPLSVRRRPQAPRPTSSPIWRAPSRGRWTPDTSSIPTRPSGCARSSTARPTCSRSLAPSRFRGSCSRARNRPTRRSREPTARRLRAGAGVLSVDSRRVYGITKLAAEQLGLYYRRHLGVDFIALRFASTYGPFKRGAGAAPAGLIAAAIEGRSLRRSTARPPSRNFWMSSCTTATLARYSARLRGRPHTRCRVQHRPRGRLLCARRRRGHRQRGGRAAPDIDDRRRP